MPEAQIGQDIGVRNERIGMQKAQGGRLDRTAEVKRTTFEGVREVRHDHLADVIPCRTIQDETEGAFRVMLADENHRALEEAPPQLSAIEQQLSFQILLCL